ncbi:MAG: T9SS type A sorting domain-containing protein [Mucilaginibacter polytrichastri]|nr:T9SS type A sorting domain-containing protein [Mucilaginibacter polytrichastri]
MKNLYLLKSCVHLFITIFLVMSAVMLSSAQTVSADSGNTKNTSSNAKSSGFFTRVKRSLNPFKTTPKPKPQQTLPQSKQQITRTESDKVLSDIKIYPNPITDQLNLSYSLRHDANITIRIMDVLGNPVVTLLQQRVSAGNQQNSFSLTNKLNSGFYFVRVTIGTESIIKRISVL